MEFLLQGGTKIFGATFPHAPRSVKDYRINDFPSDSSEQRSAIQTSKCTTHAKR